jgi:hypothetical protein
MPIPKPKAGESQKDFMPRCISQLMNYHDREEAMAICYDTWKKKNSRQVNGWTPKRK